MARFMLALCQHHGRLVGKGCAQGSLLPDGWPACSAQWEHTALAIRLALEPRQLLMALLPLPGLLGNDDGSTVLALNSALPCDDPRWAVMPRGGTSLDPWSAADLQKLGCCQGPCCFRTAYSRQTSSSLPTSLANWQVGSPAEHTSAAVWAAASSSAAFLAAAALAAWSCWLRIWASCPMMWGPSGSIPGIL